MSHAFQDWGTIGNGPPEVGYVEVNKDIRVRFSPRVPLLYVSFEECNLIWICHVCLLLLALMLFLVYERGEREDKQCIDGAMRCVLVPVPPEG